MLERLFKLSENKTTVRTEIVRPHNEDLFR